MKLNIRTRVMDRLLKPSFPDREVLMGRRVATRDVDALSDQDLERLNLLLPWKCYTVDAHGRPFGGIAGRTKRRNPQALPDPRVGLLDKHYGLTGKSVLELGCFEGVHTIALGQAGADVVAVDSRIENVVKTIVRSNLFGQRPDVRCIDVDTAAGMALLPEVDIVHHVGVLYHLADPVGHLFGLSKVTRIGMMLDTQISGDGEDTESYVAAGETWPFKRFRESGRNDVFSGMNSEAKWFSQSTLERALRRAGFNTLSVVERRDERNGPRLLMFCSKD